MPGSVSFGPLLLDLAGHDLSPIEIDLLQHPVVGGVVLFARNYASMSQLSGLTSAIHKARPGVPIMVDQEGGRVQRFATDFPQVSAMRELGDAYIAGEANEIQTHLDSFSCAMSALAHCGVNVNLAPVVDTQSDKESFLYTRSIANDAETVEIIARQLLNIMRKQGVKSSLKHFPGHGHVSLDSHHDLPVDKRSNAQITAGLELFRALFDVADSIMPAHVLYPAVDPDFPASLSTKWLQDILRGQLAYKGLIISDDLTMHALKPYGSITERAGLALVAGCDYLCVCNNQTESINVIDYLHNKLALISGADGAANARRVTFRSSFV